MPEQPNRLTGRATLVNPLGLHTRSAARIARVARSASGAVRVKHGKLEADATSVIEILTLACPAGETLEFGIEDPADSDILKTLIELVKDGFGELTR